MKRHRKSFPFALLLLGFFSAYLFAADSTGEAKKSSQESMKKVDDGNPILNQNMMQHRAQAQMYQAQMNFAMAAQENMKADMLQQQIQQNNQSKEKNGERKNRAVYTTDAPQTQLQGAPSLPSTARAARPTASSSGGPTALTPEPNGQLNSEVLVLDDSEKPGAPEAKPSSDTPTAANPSGASAAAPVTGSISGDLGDMKKIESAFAARHEDVLAPVENPISVPEPAVENTANPSLFIAPIINSADLKKLKDKEAKEKAEFWKDKKKPTKTAKKSKGKQRGIASVGKTKVVAETTIQTPQN